MDTAHMAVKILHLLLGAGYGPIAAIVCGLMIRMWEEGRPGGKGRTPEEEDAFNRYFRRTVARVGIFVGLLCAAADPFS